MNSQTLFSVLNIVGAPTVIGYLVVQLIRKYRGRQIRATHNTLTNQVNTIVLARLTDYAEALRADAQAHGYAPLAWPRGLKPKEPHHEPQQNDY